jgi:hypothetical protein
VVTEGPPAPKSVVILTVMEPPPPVTEERTLYEKFVVPVYGDPKIPAPVASVMFVVAVVMLMADSAATATERVVVPVAANCPKAWVAPAVITAAKIIEFLNVRLFMFFLLLRFM